MMKTWMACAVACGLALGFADAAAAITMGCKTKNPSSKDWVPQAVLVHIDTERRIATVVDEFTLQSHSGPVPADIDMPTDNRIKLTWKLVGIRDRTDKVQNVRFTMSVNIQRMTFNYNGVGESFFVTPGSASGSCVAVK